MHYVCGLQLTQKHENRGRVGFTIPTMIQDAGIETDAFFVWQGVRRRHSELWQRRTTRSDGKFIGLYPVSWIIVGISSNMVGIAHPTVKCTPIFFADYRHHE